MHPRGARPKAKFPINKPNNPQEVKMATRIEAITEYGPHLTLSKRAGAEDLAEFIAMRTGASEGTIVRILFELRDSLTFFLARGQPVYISGLGTYTPVIDLQGNIRVGHRADSKLKRRIVALEDYRGDVANRDNVGLSSAELVTMWNTDHPEDPIPVT
jgi:nucleoid DNA-binding protein